MTLLPRSTIFLGSPKPTRTSLIVIPMLILRTGAGVSAGGGGGTMAAKVWTGTVLDVATDGAGAAGALPPCWASVFGASAGATENISATVRSILSVDELFLSTANVRVAQ